MRRVGRIPIQSVSKLLSIISRTVFASPIIAARINATSAVPNRGRGSNEGENAVGTTGDDNDKVMGGDDGGKDGDCDIWACGVG